MEYENKKGPSTARDFPEHRGTGKHHYVGMYLSTFVNILQAVALLISVIDQMLSLAVRLAQTGYIVLRVLGKIEPLKLDGEDAPLPGPRGEGLEYEDGIEDTDQVTTPSTEPGQPGTPVAAPAGGKQEPPIFDTLEGLLEESMRCQDAVYRIQRININHTDPDGAVAGVTEMILLTVNTGQEVLCWSTVIGYFQPEEPDVAFLHNSSVKVEVQKKAKWYEEALSDVIESYTGKSSKLNSMYQVPMKVYSMPGKTALIDLESRTIRRRPAGED